MTGAGAQAMHDDGSQVQDIARANLYAIIGRLFYSAPDELLLSAITQNAEDGRNSQRPLGVAWENLRNACRSARPAELRQEFDGLFLGVGKSEVTTYTSHYVERGGSGQHLVRLRGLLAEWQLSRRDAASETEDHVSGISDVMRHLISEDDDFEKQRLFFNEFVHPGFIPFCDAIERSPNANFYRCVAQFVRSFLAVEKAAFELQDG